MRTDGNRSFRWKYVLLSVLLAAVGAAAYSLHRAPSINIDAVDPMQEPVKGDRVLIFSPHCDDETLGPGGLIQRALRAGAEVRVVMVTNGDNNIFSTDLEYYTVYSTPVQFIAAGEHRQMESIRALASLGVSQDKIYFLGYPDRGIKALYTKYWPGTRPYRSRGTRETRSVYKLSYEKGAVYSGENLLKNIEEIIRNYGPTIVVGPHWNDHHPDHRYTSRFVRRALADVYGPGRSGHSIRLYEYLVHYPRFPSPKGLKPDTYINPPYAASLDTSWVKLVLTPEEELKKSSAIMMYRSQIVLPELGRLMKSFARKNDLFERVEFAGE